MAGPRNRRRSARRIPEITAALRPYLDQHPNAVEESYPQNSASIRVRVIDPDFQGIDRFDRHDLIWPYLETLPEHIMMQITVLLLLTPEETATSFANTDFENPIPSRL